MSVRHVLAAAARLIFAAAVLAAAFALALWMLPASAEPQSCGNRATIVDRLATRFGVVETYANDTTGTWTILLSRPDGETCIVTYGEGWQGPGPKGEPA